MSQKFAAPPARVPAKKLVRDIGRATRKHHSAEDKPPTLPQEKETGVEQTGRTDCEGLPECRIGGLRIRVGTHNSIRSPRRFLCVGGLVVEHIG